MKDEVKLQFRLPTDVRDWFREYAEQRSRSMNGQMIELLKEMKAAQEEKAPNA